MYIFNSRSDTLTVVLRPTRKVVVGTQVVVEEGARARFERGIFTTEDPEIAELLRQKIKKTNDREIIEIGNEEALAFERAKKIANQRESITAPSLSKTLNPSMKLSPESTEEITCPICEPEKKFKTMKDLNLHLMGHRPGVVPAAPKAEDSGGNKPSGELTTAPEAKSTKKSPGKVAISEPEA